MVIPLQYLIFDSDGTLVDSEGLNCEALSEELALVGVAETSEALLARYRGWQFAAETADLESRHRVILDSGFVARFRARAAARFSRDLQPVAGIASALQQLHQPMCVASNGPMEKLQLALSVTGLAPHFAARVFSAYEVGSFKPDPGLFLHAARKMDAAPADCVVIEDSEVGIVAARAAGMRAVFYNPHGLAVEVPPGTLEIVDMVSLVPALSQLRAPSA